MATPATLNDAMNSPAPPLAAGILHLPVTTDAEAFGRVARASERVLVRLAEPAAAQRRGLAGFVLAGVEAELDRLGAAPRGWAAGDALEEIARDQLYRARLLGCFGIAVSFAPLGALADADGRLSAEDSETLRRLLALAEREPLQLYLPRPCAELFIAGAPQLLSAWLPPSLEPGRVATIEYDPPSAHELGPDGGAGAPESGPEATLRPPPLEAFVGGGTCAAPRGADAAPARASAAAGAPADATPADATPADTALANAAPAAATPASATPGAPANAKPADAAPAAATSAGTAPADTALANAKPAAPRPASVSLDMEPAADTPLPPRATASDAERAERCLAWAAQLQSMSGPKVHGSVEKAFIGAYLPLCRELARGGAPEAAQKAAERWAEGFAQSYASAFRQLAAGARRPRMVRDVIELGGRWLAQHHARQCQLLLVSAMRYDLGQRLNEVLEQRLGGGAVCVEQSVLWTALPSNAETQQLGEAVGQARRGRPDHSQRPGASIESGYVGSRELFRLRQLPAELTSPGEVESARIERLATELADTIVPWMQRQPPDTLLVVFGDHGFHWQVNPLGTSVAQRGGALPEQVLVPASAWLLREPRPRPRTAPGVH